MSEFRITSPLYECSIEKAFDYVSNVDNRPEWQRPLNKVERGSPAPDHAGSHWNELFHMLGTTSVARMSYTEFTRPTLFVEDADLPVCAGKIDMIFEEGDGGCHLTVAADLNWKGIYKFLAPLMTYTFKRMVRQDLEDIRRILESSEN